MIPNVKASKTLFSLLVAVFMVVSVEARYRSFEEDITLTSAQKSILDEFRGIMEKYLYQDYMKEDMFLIRWLRSQNFNLREAEKALKKSLEWRKANNIDTILEEDWSDFEEKFKVWVNEGKDKDGKPILFWNVRNHNPRKTILSGQQERFFRYSVSRLELTAKAIRDQGKKYGNVTRGHIIINLDGYSIVTHGCLRCSPFHVRLVIHAQENYPGYFDQIILLNAPGAMEPLLHILKSVMSQELREGIQVYGTNKNHWKKVLSEHFDFNELPVAIGGTKIYKGMELDEDL